MEDLLEQANEIQETLGRSYAVPDEIDEADLEAGMFPGVYFSQFIKILSIFTCRRAGCAAVRGRGRRSILPRRLEQSTRLRGRASSRRGWFFLHSIIAAFDCVELLQTPARQEAIKQTG